MPGQIGKFKFRNTDQIGATGAEEDEFLKTCFVDTGNIGILENIEDHRQIVLGRTGSGKSALLIMLGENSRNHVIRISPEGLALTYVSNSTILKFFEDLGVNLDPFFKLLWQHVLAIEILRDWFSKHENSARVSVWDNVFWDKIRRMTARNSSQNRKNQEAIQYLEKWGSKFWKETDYLVKEITQRVESELQAKIEAKLGTNLASLGGQTSMNLLLKEEEKFELKSRGTEVISKELAKELQQILGLVDTVLDDRQKACYVVIDGLDENWVEERLRYKLIMALIRNTHDFTKVRHAKLVIALRRDLIERVFNMTRTSGFQEEKYQSSYLQLHWNKEQILEVLDKRINQLIKKSYTKGSVSRQDLFPSTYKGQNIEDFIFSIAPRPRDVITFFNMFLATATHAKDLDATDLKNAEGEYSRTRLSALRDEWSGDYPTLLEFSKILHGRQRSFKIGTIENTAIAELCLQVAASEENQGGNDRLLHSARQVANDTLDIHSMKILLIQTFYEVGLIGLKLQPHESVSRMDDRRSIVESDITQDASVIVSPPYRRALGIVEKHAAP